MEGIDSRRLDEWITGHYGEDSVGPDDETSDNPFLDAIEKAIDLLNAGKANDATQELSGAGLAEAVLVQLADVDPEGFRGILFSLWAREKR